MWSIQVQDLGFFSRTAFYDEPDRQNQWRIPSIDLVHDIQERAAECDEYREGESSWNMDVHRCLLDFAFRTPGTSTLVDFRYWFVILFRPLSLL